MRSPADRASTKSSVVAYDVNASAQGAFAVLSANEYGGLLHGRKHEHAARFRYEAPRAAYGGIETLQGAVPVGVRGRDARGAYSLGLLSRPS